MYTKIDSSKRGPITIHAVRALNFHYDHHPLSHNAHQHIFRNTYQTILHALLSLLTEHVKI